MEFTLPFQKQTLHNEMELVYNNNITAFSTLYTILVSKRLQFKGEKKRKVPSIYKNVQKNRNI